MELFDLTLYQLHEMLHNRAISSRELTKTMLERIEATDPEINAFISRTADLAFEAADRADYKLATGNCTPLTGIPIALKDNIMTSGIRTTCASKMLESFIAPYDASLWVRLKEQGAVLLGKLNMDEFAMGSTNETSFFRPVHNPWNLLHSSGGSSGGAAAAVASRQTVAAIGTDTGGSVRQPAAHCGCVGLKPSYGRISRHGIIPYASSFDQAGTITRDVRDASLMLKAIAGYDVKDSTCADRAVPDYSSALTGAIRGLKIGLPEEYFSKELSADVKKAMDTAVQVFKDLGAELHPVSLPHTDYAAACYYLLANAEASSNMTRFDGVHFGYRTENSTNLEELMIMSRTEGFGDEVKFRILMGTHTLTAENYQKRYVKAQKVRRLIQQDFDNVFSKVDILLTPTTPTPAPLLGEGAEDPLQTASSDIFTNPANLAGICAISIPAGFSSNGLPIGLQLMGRPFDEEGILKAAYAFEQTTKWHMEKAAL